MIASDLFEHHLSDENSTLSSVSYENRQTVYVQGDCVKDIQENRPEHSFFQKIVSLATGLEVHARKKLDDVVWIEGTLTVSF